MQRLRREDDGVTAIIVGVMAVALLGAAGLAIDISRFTYQRELTRGAVEAGSQSGAFYLPENPSAAVNAAIAATRFVDAEATPSVDLLCVVPYVSAYGSYDSTTVSTYCNPGPVDANGRYAQSLYPGKKCDAALGICSLPCTSPCSVNTSVSPAVVAAGYRFNTMSVNDTRTVEYLFGSAMNVFSATFGSSGQVAAACKGAGCGSLTPAPMNIVIVLDRSGSVSTAERRAMVTSIQGMFKLMTPRVQFVALGAFGKSYPNATCLTEDASQSQITASSNNQTKWVPVPFSSDYLSSPGVLNMSSTIISKALGNGTSGCLSSDGANSGTGSFLAASLKGAARYLLDGANLSGLPSRTGTVQNVIFFESDGEPGEGYSLRGSSSTSLSDGNEVYSSNSQTRCDNLKAVAANAKDAGIAIFSVAFGADDASCGSGDAVGAMAAIAGTKTKSSTPNYVMSSSSQWDNSAVYQGAISCSTVPSGSRSQSAYPSCYGNVPVWNTNLTYQGAISCSTVPSGSRSQSAYPSCYSNVRTWNTNLTYTGSIDCDTVSSGKTLANYPDCFSWDDDNTYVSGGRSRDCDRVSSDNQSPDDYPTCYDWDNGNTYQAPLDCPTSSSANSRYDSCWQQVPTWTNGNTYTGPVDCPTSSSTNSQYDSCWEAQWGWSSALTYSGSIACSTVSSGNRGLAQYAACWALVQTPTTDCDVVTENTDGDHFFCAASGNDFAGIFQAAFTQLLKNSKFIRLP